MEDGERESDQDLDIDKFSDDESIVDYEEEDELVQLQYTTTKNPRFKWRQRESRNSRWSY